MKACDCVIFWSSTLRRGSHKPGVKIVAQGNPPPDADRYEYCIDCSGRAWRINDICNLQERLIGRGVDRDAAHSEFMRIDEYRDVMQ